MEKKIENRRLGYTKRNFETFNNSEEQKMIIRGYAILFEEPTIIHDFWDGTYTETIKRGALDKTDLSNVLLLYDHDHRNVLGRNGANLRLDIDDIGLFYEVELPNTSLARDVYALVEERSYLGSKEQKSIIDGNSFGFYSEDSVRMGKRDIKRIDILDEISIVSRPAYELACSIVSNERKKDGEVNNRDKIATEELQKRIKLLEDM